MPEVIQLQFSFQFMLCKDGLYNNLSSPYIATVIIWLILDDYDGTW